MVATFTHSCTQQGEAVGVCVFEEGVCCTVESTEGETQRERDTERERHRERDREREMLHLCMIT